MQAVGPAVFLNEPLRAQCVTNQDPFAAKWERLHAAESATVMSYDPRGVFLAIGTIFGEVILWDIAAARSVVSCLRIPKELPSFRSCAPVLGSGAQSSRAMQESISPSQLVRPTPSIAALAWSASGHLLFAATYSGLLVVWHAQTGALLRAVGFPALMPGSASATSSAVPDAPAWLACGSIRGLRPHPLLPHLLLVVPGEGTPLLLDWVTGRGWQIPEAVLPAVRGRPPKPAPAPAGFSGPAAAAGARHGTAHAGAGHGGAGGYFHGFGPAGSLGSAEPAHPHLDGHSSRGSGVGGSAGSQAAPSRQPRCDAAWHGAHGAFLYLLTARSGASEVSKLAFGAVVIGLRAMQAWLQQQARQGQVDAAYTSSCAAAAASDAAALVSAWEHSLESAYAAAAASSPASADGHRSLRSRPAGVGPASDIRSVFAGFGWWPPPHAVYRVASVPGPQPLPLPELSHCARIGSLLLTSRAGITLLHDSDLSVRERGYADVVDATPLTSARLAVGARLIVALAAVITGGVRGHKQGGLYCFHRGKPGGAMRWRAPPKDSYGIVAVEAHPRLGMVACLGSRGMIWLLAPEPRAHFPGTMFPPGFVMMMANKEYTEAEDEFDRESTMLCCAT